METNKLADEKGLKVVVGLQRRHSQQFLRQGQARSKTARSASLMLHAAPTGTAAASGSASASRARPKWNTRCATGITSSGSAATTSSSSTSTTSTSATGSRATIPSTANGMGSCHMPQQPRHRPDLRQPFRRVHLQGRHEDLQPVPPAAERVERRHADSSTAPRASMELPGGGGDGYKQEHVDLVNAIRNGEKLNDGWHGATSSFTARAWAAWRPIPARRSTGTRPWPRARTRCPKRFAFDADPPAMPDKDGNYPHAGPRRLQAVLSGSLLGSLRLRLAPRRHSAGDAAWTTAARRRTTLPHSIAVRSAAAVRIAGNDAAHWRTTGRKASRA